MLEYRRTPSRGRFGHRVASHKASPIRYERRDKISSIIASLEAIAAELEEGDFPLETLPTELQEAFREAVRLEGELKEAKKVAEELEAKVKELRSRLFTEIEGIDTRVTKDLEEAEGSIKRFSKIAIKGEDITYTISRITKEPIPSYKQMKEIAPRAIRLKSRLKAFLNALSEVMTLFQEEKEKIEYFTASIKKSSRRYSGFRDVVRDVIQKIKNWARSFVRTISGYLNNLDRLLDDIEDIVLEIPYY